MYVPIINAALKDQVKQYINNRDTVYVRSGKMYEALIDLYINTGSNWARHTKDLLKKDGGMGFSERIVSFIRHYFSFNLLEDAENITQTTIRLIQEVLSDAALEGWSFDEIVNKLETPDFTATRARLIARTETVGAANAGSLLNAKATGLELNKIWITARDNRTREHHREANQTVIPIDEQFKVGDSLLGYPGDKNGSAAEVCNCRCAIAFIPVGDMPIKMEDVVLEHKRQIEPFMDMVNASVSNINDSINHQVKINSLNITKFTEGIRNIKFNIPVPVVNLEAPIVNLPAPIVNVEAPIIEVIEQKVDQSEVLNTVDQGVLAVVTVADKIIDGQEKIIELLKESIKPKPKRTWEFTNIIEGGRIVRSIAKEK